MKNVSLLLSLLLIVFLFSCSKTNQENVSQRNLSSLKEGQDPCNGLPPQHLVTDLRFLGDIFCTWPCMNCFYEVIIIGSQESNPTTILYNSFLSHIDNNSLDAFFRNENYSAIFPYLTTDLANQIINGDFDVIKRQSTMDKDIELYILVYSEDVPNLLDESNIFLVFQIKIEEE